MCNGTIRNLPSFLDVTFMAIILDLDGTLLHSVYQRIVAWHIALHQRVSSMLMPSSV
jgi:hypothetical protein